MSVQAAELSAAGRVDVDDEPVTRAFQLLDERLATAIAEWRLRQPSRLRGRRVEEWVREGQELIQTRARFLLLARQYGYIDGWR